MSSTPGLSTTITRSATSASLPPQRTTSNNAGSDQGSSIASAALYLYTFLATLLLLLAISSTIVIRSVYLRRRRRRIIQEAIQNGVWPPGVHLARLGVGSEFGADPGGSATFARTKDIGKKPKMWEVYLHDAEGRATRSRLEDTKEEKAINLPLKIEKGLYWDDILPLHAALVEDDKQDGSPNKGFVQVSPTQEEERGLTHWASRRRRRRRRNVQVPLSPLSASIWRIALPHSSRSPSRGPEILGGAAQISSSPPSSSSNAVSAEAHNQRTLLEVDVFKPTPATVAMLIAMPRPPPPCGFSDYHVSKTSNNTPSATMLSHTPLTPPSSTTPLNSSNTGQTQTEQGEGEVFFPHLELGVAEVVVLPLSETDYIGEGGDRGMEERVKERS